jgi:hypothetical protein
MMKTIDELDHYEVLEVAREARRDDIERAFSLVRTAYADDGLAAYSVLSPEETKLWRERIEEAWRVLSDPEQRSLYDATLDVEADCGGDLDPFAAGADDAADATGAARVAATAEGYGEPVGRGWLRIDGAPGAHAASDAGYREPAPLPEAPNALPSFVGDAYRDRPLQVEAAPARDRAAPPALESFEESEGVDTPWDGARLRRARLARGLEIEDVAGVTKINPTYLRFLEDERFEDLPAVVYVRGFVSAYARLLGLDPAHVAPSYVSRCEEHRGPQSRARVHGRR